MKKVLKTSVAVAMVLLTLTACASARSGAHSNNARQTPRTLTKSVNEYDLDIASESVSYTIDISTAEGRAKLNKLSLSEAEDLALTEAVIKYRCALLFNPQFTHLKKGRKILRITVYGFPATFKNTK